MALLRAVSEEEEQETEDMVPSLKPLLLILNFRGTRVWSINYEMGVRGKE